MRILSILLVLFACAACASAPTVAPAAVVAPADLQLLEGAPWSGHLTYRDYGTGRAVSIPARIIVAGVAGNARGWTTRFEYPAEPGENSQHVATLSADGREWDGEEVVERSRSADGTVVIITRQTGRDDDRDAEFRFTYRIAPRQFSLIKEVRFAGEREYFERNRYVMAR